MRVLVGGGVGDADGDELGCALAVADDQLGQVDGEVGQCLLEGGEVGGRGAVDGLAAGGTVGEDGDGVVGRGVAVDGDAVERLGDGGRERSLQRARGDGGVGADDAEQGGHVGVDHAGALGHAGDVVLFLAAGEGEGLGEQLGECVRGADGFGSAQPVFMCLSEVAVDGWDLGDDLLDGQSLADDASAHDNASAMAIVLTIAVFDKGLVGLPAHQLGILDTAFPCHGIGAAAVDDDRPDTLPLTALQEVPAHCDRRGLELVGGEDGSSGARRIGRNEGEVVKARVGGFHADVCTPSLESERVRAGARYVLLLRGGDGAVARCRIASCLRREDAVGAGKKARVGACEGHGEGRRETGWAVPRVCDNLI